MSKSLADLRAEIDAIDAELLQLLSQRAACALQTAVVKAGAVYDPSREKEIITTLLQRNKSDLSDDAVERIFQRIIAECRALQG